ncbi:MAG: NAD(P)/FAD-dependent oxidoreductase [Candidatus Promineifilaceae bacterium]
MAGSRQTQVVICGAGIAGIAAAYFLNRSHQIKDIIVVDDRAPLTLTSDKSSEAYRNWWPGPGAEMVQFMNRSIDLLELLADESDNCFHLNRRGYLYLTSVQRQAQCLLEEAQQIAQLGAGPLRTGGEYSAAASRSYREAPAGADYISDPRIIREAFPYLAPDIHAVLHARRCGWLSAQQLGMYLWEEARRGGARLLAGKVTGVTLRANRIQAVQVQADHEQINIATNVFVNAAGPFLAQVGRLLGVELPVFNELHSKIVFEDTEGIIDREAPLVISTDPIELPWRDAERVELMTDEDAAWLLEPFAPGLHFRPEGGPGSQTILALWPYHIDVATEPHWPLSFDPEHFEIVLRGLSRLVPDLAVYQERLPRPSIDGGYYCKTKENRPLIGPLPVDGAFVIGALSGYGIMAAPAAAELVSAHVTGSALPAYSASFNLDRYEDAAYQRLLADWDHLAGQL